MPLTHRFQVGAFACVIIQDGHGEPNEDFYQRILYNVDTEALHAVYSQRPQPTRTSMNLLLIQTGTQTILIDTGNGPARPGTLPEGLAELGMRPEQIDLIFLTHFHGDHINGLLDAAGASYFPNARIVTNRAEWEGWMSDAARERIGEGWEARFKAVLALRERIGFIEAGDEIAPGVRTVAAYGHTPGHTGMLLESQGEKLLHLVDSIHYGLQLAHPDWSLTFDSDPVQAAHNRRERLGEAADQNLRLLLYHFEFPGLGRVQRVGDGFAWTPEA